MRIKSVKSRKIKDPSKADLAADPLRMRFRLISDRESYSPGLFKRMAAKRIAGQIYLSSDGRQNSIISTDWQATAEQIVGRQFGRWYQENFSRG